MIDARDGRVVRFVPAWRTGGNFHTDVAVAYGPPGPPPVSVVRGPPRPPALIPHVANRTVPLPRATPQRSGRTAGRRQARGVHAAIDRDGDEADSSRTVDRGRGKARPTDPADSGNAEGAGSGVTLVVPAPEPGSIRRVVAFEKRRCSPQPSRRAPGVMDPRVRGDDAKNAPVSQGAFMVSANICRYSEAIRQPPCQECRRRPLARWRRRT